MKTTLDLPADLVREVEERAMTQGRTLKELVTEFLQQGLALGLGKSPPVLLSSAMVQISENGLPVIRSQPGSPASKMNLQELLKMEQSILNEEDLAHAGISL